MASYETTEIQKLTTVTSSSEQVATFEGGISALSITTDQDVYINFDGHPVSSAANQGFLVKANVTQEQINFNQGLISKVRVIAVGSSANVYLLGVR